MNSQHDRHISQQQSTSTFAPAPEIPRRVRQGQHSSGPLVREIHKNAWLKHWTPFNEKKGTPFIKKYEKHWVIFCVHDDIEAVLEFYNDPKIAVAHKPLISMSLNNCMHVTKGLQVVFEPNGHNNNEYEFVISWPTQVIRLVAANWEQMTEWVESLQGKLREMNILKPKDNLYSQMPAPPPCNSNLPTHNFPSVRFPNSTRDPNSPLPPPPISSPLTVLGTEAVRPSSSSTVRGNDLLIDQQTPLRIPVNDAPLSQTVVASSISSNCIVPSAQVVTVSNHSRNNEIVVGESGLSHVQNLLVDSTTTIPLLPVNSMILQPTSISTATSRPLNQDADALIRLSCENLLNNQNIGEDPTVTQAVPATTNTIHVTFGDSNIATNPFSSAFLQNNNNNPVGNNNFCVSSPFVTKCPILPPPPSLLSCQLLGSASNQMSLQSSAAASIPTTSNSCRSLQPSTTCRLDKLVTPPLERQHSAPLSSQFQRSNSQENVYEHLFIPNNTVVGSATASTSVVSLKTLSSGSTSNSSSSKDRRNNNNMEEVPPIIPRRNPNSRKIGSSSGQRSSSLSRLQPQLERSHRSNGDATTSSSSTHHHRRCVDVIRAFDSDTATAAHSSSHHDSYTVEANRARPMDAMIGFRKGEYRIRRDDVQNGSVLEGGKSAPNGASHIPLKEQQVMRLKAEINNAAGGVRIILRKKDCVDSIAFVDYLGATWIAGWKQLQQPVLYYAFHIGDQILKVAGVQIHNSIEAYRAIKIASSMQVEFIIRRLPYGKVLVIKRKKGESLGLNCTGNSGEVEVQPDGLAASHGLPLQGPSASDSQTTCNWFLTEINNRPLSLFPQKNEIRERLNLVVGNEASILVQPADLVKHLRKQLKSMKNFKDYLVV